MLESHIDTTSTSQSEIPDKITNKLTNALNRFESHSLSDLNKAKLMDRVDVKFMLPTAILPELLDQMRAHYSILEINNKRISTYYNEYFDTTQMDFYQDHHNGKLNRFKVRQRTYVDTDTKFLEVKFKNNRKRTIKTRVPGTTHLNDDERCQAFIADKLGQPLNGLIVSHQSGYQRIALANEENAERLTLDFDLWYQKDSQSDKLELDGFFIAELKQSKRCKRSPFYQLMSKHNIFPASFSKYCIGCAMIYGDKHRLHEFTTANKNPQHIQLKTNQFKTTLAKIKQFGVVSNTAKDHALNTLEQQELSEAFISQSNAQNAIWPQTANSY